MIKFIHCGVNTFFPKVFNFYFDKIYIYKKVTTVVQSFYVDSLGVHLFIDT